MFKYLEADPRSKAVARNAKSGRNFHNRIATVYTLANSLFLDLGPYRRVLMGFLLCSNHRSGLLTKPRGVHAPIQTVRRIGSSVSPDGRIAGDSRFEAASLSVIAKGKVYT